MFVYSVGDEMDGNFKVYWIFDGTFFKDSSWETEATKIDTNLFVIKTDSLSIIRKMPIKHT